MHLNQFWSSKRKKAVLNALCTWIQNKRSNWILFSLLVTLILSHAILYTSVYLLPKFHFRIFTFFRFTYSKWKPLPVSLAHLISNQCSLWIDVIALRRDLTFKLEVCLPFVFASCYFLTNNTKHRNGKGKNKMLNILLKCRYGNLIEVANREEYLHFFLP